MTTAVTSQEHLIGLLLGAEEDWPTAFEALARRLGVLARRRRAEPLAARPNG